LPQPALGANLPNGRATMRKSCLWMGAAPLSKIGLWRLYDDLHA